MNNFTKTALFSLIAILLLGSAVFYIIDNQLDDESSLPASADMADAQKSPNLIEQNLEPEDENFSVLATQLDLDNHTYKLAFKLDNNSHQDKDFYLIPVSHQDQTKFQSIKGDTKGGPPTGEARPKGGTATWDYQADWDFDTEKHKQQLIPELAQAYDDIDNNDYTGKPIKLTLTPQTTLTAQSEWGINQRTTGLKPVYFLIYGSAGGAKDDLTILNVHSHPQAGDDWTVSFTTQGTADLTITPQDQATINDLDFISLKCGENTIKPQILEDDIIFYPNWQCLDTGQLTHLVNVEGKHTLEFKFREQTARAYNGTITWDGSDSAEWTTDANWVGGSAPGETDDVIIDGNYTNAPVISTEVTVASLAIGENNVSLLSFTQDDTTADITTTGDITVYANGTINVTRSSTTGNGTGRTITATNIDIQSGGTIEADGEGFAATYAGPGAPTNATTDGAAHGGRGGDYQGNGTTATTYGSLTNPTALGSSSGTAGGGAIIVSASGTVTVSGTLSANGTDDTAAIGAGSGGSINITAATLAGSGTIQVHGGNGDISGGGGGGGRVAIYYTTSYDITPTATGGTGAPAGADGTVFITKQSVSPLRIKGDAGGLRFKGGYTIK